MNPTPEVVLAILTVSVLSALSLVAMVLIFARCVWPRVEGWCTRHENRFVSALAMAEDAALPWAAKRRARALFLAKLSEAQSRSWHLRRRFEVLAASGRRYTISRYRPFNICTRDAVFCVQVSACVPVYDKLLAQKLLLECDEELFLARANVRTFSRSWGPLMTAARAHRP